MYKCLQIKNIIIYFLFISNHKCTPSDRQMYPQGYMYPRLGTLVLDGSISLKFSLESKLESDS